MNPCLIVNPNAGSAEELELIEQSLAPLGKFPTWRTKGPLDARDLACQAIEKGIDYIIAGGGDGTINEVVNGLVPAGYEGKLGILPIGTGNDLTRSLYPNLVREDVIRILTSADAVPVDLAKLRWDHDERFFINASAAGFSAAVSQEMNTDMKRWLGWAAYPIAAISKLDNAEAYDCKLVIDGEETRKLDAFNIIVSNGGHIGGGIPVAPQAQLNDGLLDLFIFPAMRLGHAINLTPLIWAGQHIEHEEFIVRRVRELEFRVSQGIPLNADGESLGNVKEAHYSVIPNTLNLVTGGGSNLVKKS